MGGREAALGSSVAIISQSDDAAHTCGCQQQGGNSQKAFHTSPSQ